MNVQITLKAHPHQKEVLNYFRGGGKRAYCVWHRKAGKDRMATFLESELAIRKPGLYWHALPAYADARKVVWDAITLDGKKLIDVSFPPEIVKQRWNHEMKIELVNGSIWQPVGADNYDSLVGAFPSHVTYSEYALMHPNTRTFLRPAIALGNGSELIITTPRGYNHAHTLWEHAKESDEWFDSLKTVDDTHLLSDEILAEERADMPDELYRQEYYCDFSAANVGAILGGRIEAAENEGRITEVAFNKNAPVHVSSDIGYHDTATWWFWQPRPDGFDLIDYDEDTGMDAEDWLERIGGRYPYAKVWLPQDAKIKSFQSKRSALEIFMDAGLPMDIVPALSKSNQINAARMVVKSCRFDKIKCRQGLMALREWSFKYNEKTHSFSREPEHNWASHPGDGFAYGSIVMRELKLPKPKPRVEPKPQVTIDQFINASERGARSERI